jgi:hypothetical protein
MNRRDFFKLTGLGSATIFLAPAVLGSAWTAQWNAQDAVKFAVAQALAQGATYADACIGPCEVVGHQEDFSPSGLFESDLLGMRICTAQGWRKVVLREFDRESIQQSLSSALSNAVPKQAPREYWLAAKFCKETAVAHVSSDSTLEFGLNTAMLRYGQPLDLPLNGPNTLFCDILLHQ